MMTEDEILTQIIQDVPQLSQAKRLIKEKLTGGLSNTSYLVTADEEQFVVRIAGKAGATLGTDRAREAAASQRAQQAGIAPEVFAFFLPEGHSVTRYIGDARPLTMEEFSSREMIPKVAARLREIHALEPIEGRFNPYENIRTWLQIVEARKITCPSRLGTLLMRVDTIEKRRLQSGQLSSVLCHNDPYYENFLYDGSLWVIDWEYAGMGDPLYDLAGVGYALDTAGRDLLVASYFGQVNQAARLELDDLIAVFLCWNIVWALVQHSEGGLDHDYAAFAEELLDLVP